jgi:hypothetical protein
MFIALGIALLAINLYFGITDLREKRTEWRPALTWFAIGIIVASMIL